MKKTTLLLLLVMGMTASYGQVTSQLNFGGLGTGLYVIYDIPVASAIAISPMAKTNWDFNHITLGVAGNYYFDALFGLPDVWDVYAGLNAGWNIKFNDKGNEGFDMGLHAGGRWFWSPKWGINAQIGGGNGGMGGGVGLTMIL